MQFAVNAPWAAIVHLLCAQHNTDIMKSLYTKESRYGLWPDTQLFFIPWWAYLFCSPNYAQLYGYYILLFVVSCCLWPYRNKPATRFCFEYSRIPLLTFPYAHMWMNIISLRRVSSDVVWLSAELQKQCFIIMLTGMLCCHKMIERAEQCCFCTVHWRSTQICPISSAQARSCILSPVRFQWNSSSVLLVYAVHSPFFLVRCAKMTL